MLALQITSLKNFMNHLLAGDLFDIFLLEEASISTAITIQIDGSLNQKFFPTEEWEDKTVRPYDFIAWKDIKGTCFNLIKGKRTPSHFQFVFHLMPAHVSSILQKGNATISPELVKAFVVTIRFDGEKATLYTGTSFTTFIMDKEPERLWDEAFKQYLYKKEIACEQL